MSFDTSGAVLEGVRLSQSVNTLVLPPRTLVQPQDTHDFNKISQRAEYCIFVTGQSKDADGIYINDPNLKFRWTRNDSIFRFSYDNVSRRWFPAPGSSPTRLGVISNENRLTAPIPVDNGVSNYQVYVSVPRVYEFQYVLVLSFSNPPPGTVEINRETGELNFSEQDISNPDLANQIVYISRQSFFNRARFNGNIITINSDGSYEAFLNPIPTSGEYPLLRIGYTEYLVSISYPNESSMPVPTSSGIINYALDTGRAFIYDSEANSGETIFYDGVINGETSANQYQLAVIPDTSPFLPLSIYIGQSTDFINLDDTTRFLFWGSRSEKDYYLNVSVVDENPTFTDSGTIEINKVNGNVYMNSYDCDRLKGSFLRYLDSYLEIENGITFQIFRSGANETGFVNSYDFFEYYKITNSVMSDNISGSPFLFLPSRPIDDSYLSYRVTDAPGSSGTFSGSLKKAENPEDLGLGYKVDFSTKTLSFSKRVEENKTVGVTTNILKLKYAALIPGGFEIKKNNEPLDSSDYSLDIGAGLVTFLESVGENDELNAFDVLGHAQGDTFTSFSFQFNALYVNKYILVSIGENVGFYRIKDFINGNTIRVEGLFPKDENVTVDIKSTKEIICDRVWTSINPRMKLFTLEKKNPDTGEYEYHDQSNYSIIPELGQITLNETPDPNDVFRANYLWINSPIEGINRNVSELNVKVTKEEKIEILASKIRLEKASYVKGKNYVSINQDNKSIVPLKGFRVIADGITVPASQIRFINNNSIFLGIILENQEIYVDYWIEENTGGSRVFTLINTPIDIDIPEFIPDNDNKILVINEDFTGIIKPGSAICVQDTNIYIVEASVYDSLKDTTSIVFESPIQVSYKGIFKTCDPVSLNQVTQASKTCPKGSNSVIISGSVDVKENYLIKINDFPFIVITSSYDIKKDVTSISFKSVLPVNAIIPSIFISLGPVVDPKPDFSTRKSAVFPSPFTLLRGGVNPRVLSNEIDYIITDGGSITLRNNLEYGQTLECSYVARQYIPSDTRFEFNYSYAIAPDESSNGLLGQALLSNYNLYSPDSFFFRAETFKSYIPELADALSTPTTSTTSGPVFSNFGSIRNKDFGIPSLYFDETRYQNLDTVTKRLLLFYNNFTNYYEDLLSNYDGRVVGGTDGKFKYNLTSQQVQKYSDINNDIDDSVLLYHEFGLISFIPPEIGIYPVYGFMWESNKYSRLFSTVINKNFVVNDKAPPDLIENLFSIMGNVGVKNIESMSVIRYALAIESFKRINFNTVRIEKNGDPKTLTPPFKVGQPVFIYENNGTILNQSDPIYISKIEQDPNGFYLVSFLNIPIPINIPLYGGMAKNGKAIDNQGENVIYFDNIDVYTDFSTGELTNITIEVPFVNPLEFQRAFVANSVLNTTVTYNNNRTSPQRIPVLKGSIYNDDGLPSNPPLRRDSEILLLQDELEFWASVLIHGGKVGPTGPGSLDIIFDSNLNVNVGDVVVFLNGPNLGQERLVIQIIDPSRFRVNSAFANSTVSQSIIEKVSVVIQHKSILSKELDIIKNNADVKAVAPALIGLVNSEITCLDSIINEMGETVYEGSGLTTLNTITDTSKIFENLENSYVWVTEGSNYGLYQIDSFLNDTVTIITEKPFYAFTQPIVTKYKVIKLFGWLSTLGPEFLAPCYKSTNKFYEETKEWYETNSWGDITERVNNVSKRQLELFENLDRISQIMNSGDSLYNRRYLWIQQRTDRLDGWIPLRNQAINKRIADTAKLVNNQVRISTVNALRSLGQ